MPAPLRINLTKCEVITLEELRVAPKVVQRTKDRAHMLLLNAQGFRVSQIARVFNCQGETVRCTIHRWQEDGLMGLWDAPGRGVKPRCEEKDWQYLEKLLEEDARSYTSKQLAEKLATERQVNLSTDRIRKGLKKRGTVGSEPGSRIKPSKTPSSSKQSLLTL